MDCDFEETCDKLKICGKFICCLLFVVLCISRIIFGIGSIIDASDFKEWTESATNEICDIIDSEKVGCGRNGNAFIYIAVSETKCGNQTLKSDEDHGKCASGSDHEKDQGEYDCLIADCEEGLFVLKSRSIKQYNSYIGWGIAWIVIGTCCCCCPCCAYFSMFMASELFQKRAECNPAVPTASGKFQISQSESKTNKTHYQKHKAVKALEAVPIFSSTAAPTPAIPTAAPPLFSDASVNGDKSTNN